MFMEIKEISYANLTTGAAGSANQAILRQIPSGNIRPPALVVIDEQYVAANTPYSPRNPIRVMQENTVMEASTSIGPMMVNFAYRLRYGRP